MYYKGSRTWGSGVSWGWKSERVGQAPGTEIIEQLAAGRGGLPRAPRYRGTGADVFSHGPISAAPGARHKAASRRAKFIEFCEQLAEQFGIPVKDPMYALGFAAMTGMLPGSGFTRPGDTEPQPLTPLEPRLHLEAIKAACRMIQPEMRSVEVTDERGPRTADNRAALLAADPVARALFERLATMEQSRAAEEVPIDAEFSEQVDSQSTPK